MILRTVSLIFLWLLWINILTHFFNWLLNRDMNGFFQLVGLFSAALVTFYLIKLSTLFINKKLKKND